MFRIVCDPSSGSMELYLTEIIRSGSQMFAVCLVGVWQHLNFYTTQILTSTFCVIECIYPANKSD